ncbi:IclR family transcriptional regulator [Thioalkalivibrio sulfidiphilus]|uniref:IclR family transcriptional regulator n=1 Tax=Thioalkalivibrio sulfidiphilus TaxID=1033854 RepID=UPI003B2FBCCA
MKTHDRPSGSIQVIDRASDLLEAIARYTQSVSLKVLAAETGLHPSTAFRILASLVEHDFVVRDEGGTYRLGPRFLKYAARVRADLDLRAVARPEMERLLGTIGETVNLTVREGDEVIYVERALPNRMMRVEQLIGSRAPLHVTAVGKIMLGDAGPEETLAYARRTGLPAYTPRTINDPERLLAVAERAVKDGFAFDNEEAETGVGCIGALVRDGSGTAIAGLSVSAPIERRRDEWVPLLVAAAVRISERLGYRAEAPREAP